jgi:hypothetical protein
MTNYLTTSYNGSVSLKVTGSIALNNQYIQGTNSTPLFNLTSGVLYENIWMAPTTAQTVTLPTITSTMLGQRFTFRRTNTAAVAITFNSDGTQNIYTTSNSTGTSVALLPSGTNLVVLITLIVSGTTYGWFQC